LPTRERVMYRPPPGKSALGMMLAYTLQTYFLLVKFAAILQERANREPCFDRFGSPRSQEARKGC
jgi:hypothetical protein